MLLKIVCIGDVVGRPGREALAYWIPKLTAEQGIHCFMVNAENTASGSGLNPQLYDKIMRYGANLITMGDHIYRRREILPVLERSEQICRPANLPAESIGRDVAIYRPGNGGPAVAVISLLGRLYMKTMADCPFHAVRRVLDRLAPDVKLILVDMHAEATSEKMAMGWYLDGQVTAVVGTHTHVATADERVLPHRTAYISDLGMTGPYESILGRDVQRVLRAMTTGMPTEFDVAENDVKLCGVTITAESETGRAVSIERLCLPVPASALHPGGT
jgi:2',3'-cyclic-nucleotide 2'-phosphodiesterase